MTFEFFTLLTYLMILNETTFLQINKKIFEYFNNYNFSLYLKFFDFIIFKNILYYLKILNILMIFIKFIYNSILLKINLFFNII